MEDDIGGMMIVMACIRTGLVRVLSIPFLVRIFETLSIQLTLTLARSCGLLLAD